MGHEVAHATMRHGGKRMTNAMILQATAAAIGVGLSMSEMSTEAQAGLMAAFGVGTQVGVSLPFSRGHETEADLEGIRYAVRAGYDPYEAVRLWERMAQDGNGGPEWLSTHPDSLGRAKKLEQEIPRIVQEEGKSAVPQPQPNAPMKQIRR
jgi:predicted Zn-dependent protease